MLLILKGSQEELKQTKIYLFRVYPNILIKDHTKSNWYFVISAIKYFAGFQIVMVAKNHKCSIWLLKYLCCYISKLFVSMYKMPLPMFCF